MNKIGKKNQAKMLRAFVIKKLESNIYTVFGAIVKSLYNYRNIQILKKGVFHLEEPGQNLVMRPSNFSISYKMY